MQHDPSGEEPALAGAVVGPVQLGGCLGVGVLVEEPVDVRQGLGLGLARLPGRRRDGDRDAGGLSAAEAGVEPDLAVLDQGDIVEEQSGDALVFPQWGFRIGPQGGEIGGEGADAPRVFFIEDGPGGGYTWTGVVEEKGITGPRSSAS